MRRYTCEYTPRDPPAVLVFTFLTFLTLLIFVYRSSPGCICSELRQPEKMEVQPISKEMDELCRLCLADNCILEDMFAPSLKSTTLLEKISFSTSIQVKGRCTL